MLVKYSEGTWKSEKQVNQRLINHFTGAVGSLVNKSEVTEGQAGNTSPTQQFKHNFRN